MRYATERRGDGRYRWGNARDRLALLPNAGQCQPQQVFADIDPLIGIVMNLNLSIGPLVSLIAGILILLMPRLLNFIVAIYLIVIGLIGLFGVGALHIR